jgi:hypothetical protein
MADVDLEAFVSRAIAIAKRFPDVEGNAEIRALGEDWQRLRGIEQRLKHGAAHGYSHDGTVLVMQPEAQRFVRYVLTGVDE